MSVVSRKGDFGEQMRDRCRVAGARMLIALSAAFYSVGQDSTMAQPAIDRPAPTGSPRGVTVMVFDSHALQGILGKEVRSAADENMGRIVNVIGIELGSSGQPSSSSAAFLALVVAKSRSHGLRCTSRPMQKRAVTLPWS